MTPDFSTLRVCGRKRYAVVSRKSGSQWQVLGQDIPAERIGDAGDWRAKSIVELNADGGPSDWQDMNHRDKHFGSMGEVEAVGETGFSALRALQISLERFYGGDTSGVKKLRGTPHQFYVESR